MWKIYNKIKSKNTLYFIPYRRGLWYCTGNPINDMLPFIIFNVIYIIFFGFFLEMYFSIYGFQLRYIILYILFLVIFPVIYIYPFSFVRISDKEIIYKKLFDKPIIIPFEKIVEFRESTLILHIKLKTGKTIRIDLRRYKMSCVTLIKNIIKQKLNDTAN